MPFNVTGPNKFRYKVLFLKLHMIQRQPSMLTIGMPVMPEAGFKQHEFALGVEVCLYVGVNLATKDTLCLLNGECLPPLFTHFAPRDEI
jgi:hypothetical protein